MTSIDSTDRTEMVERPEAAERPEKAERAEQTAPNDRRWRFFWLLLLVAALPMLVPYFIEMWKVDWYQYFPFVITAVVGLAYVRSDGKFYPPRRVIHWVAIGLGILLLIAAAVFQFTWFAAVALFLFGTVCLSVMRGPRDASLLVLAVPLAMLVSWPGPDKILVRELQGITTWLASVMLDTFGAPHSITGNVIQLASKELFVAEACSGIQSVFTLAFLACLMIAVQRRPIWLVPLYLGIAIFLAVAANVIRVTTVALAEVWYEVDLTRGWQHETVGYIALVIAALFLLSFDQLIVVVLHRVSELTSNPLVKLWNRLAISQGAGEVTPSEVTRRLQPKTQDELPLVELAVRLSKHEKVRYLFIAATVLVALFSVAQVIRSRKPATYATDGKSVVFQPPGDLVDGLNFLKVTDHRTTREFSDPRLGANADIWLCEADDLKAELVLSQPHSGWHELCVCYERQEWMLVDRDMTEVAEEVDMELVDTKKIDEAEIDEVDSDDVPFVIARFKKPKLYGYLFFGGIGSDGSLIPAPSSLGAFTHRVWNRIDSTGVWEQNEVLMLQLWVVSPRRLEPETVKALEDDFVNLRSKIADTIMDVRGGSGQLDVTDKANVQSASIAFQTSVKPDRDEPGAMNPEP